MKQFIVISSLALSAVAGAQPENVGEDTAAKKFSAKAIQNISTPPSDTAWKYGGNFGLQFNQAAYSYWQSGGVNSIAGNSLLTLFANYDDSGKWTWDNRLDLAYGLNYQDDIFNKTDDRIELESRVDRKVSKQWSISALLNFRTQFTAGFSEPGETADSVKVSDFMAPGYLMTGLGMTYKPNKHFTAFISPVTGKFTFVNDQRLANEGSFGVEPAVYDSINGERVVVEEGEQFRAEVGGYINLAYKRKIMKNIDLQARLDLFSNYLNNNYKYIDVKSEVQLFMKINEYITANVSFNLIYDHDVRFDTDGDGMDEGPRTQFKEVIGIGLSYSFGDGQDDA